MNRRRRILFAIPALVALLVGVVAAGPAQADPAAGLTADAIAVENDEALNAPTSGPKTCHGMAVLGSLVRMNDIPQVDLPENGAFVPLPGAEIDFTVPAGDVNQILVTFTAEARVQGQPLTNVAPVDFLQIQITLDGVAMDPLNDLSFNTDAGQANAARACHRVGPGMHTVRVEWMLVDQGGANVLTADIDDWLLEIRISD